MKGSEINYQIFIGCKDRQLHYDFVKQDEIIKIVSDYFFRKRIGFSIVQARGGYLLQDGTYSLKDTVMVTLVGNQGLDVVKLAKGLAMLMNQEKVLLVQKNVEMKYQ